MLQESPELIWKTLFPSTSLSAWNMKYMNWSKSIQLCCGHFESKRGDNSFAIEGQNPEAYPSSALTMKLANTRFVEFDPIFV